MFIRALDENGDITTKLKKNEFAIEQLIKTRLRMIKGDWFLNKEIGFDLTLLKTKDAESLSSLIKQTILETEGVMLVNSFSYNLTLNKELNINCDIITKYSSNYKLNLTI